MVKNIMKKIILIFTWTFVSCSFIENLIASDKILIITHSYCRPDFIEWQDKTFRKFIKDKYEFVVFNDAAEEGMAQQIDAMCNNLAIQSIRVPQEIHTRPYLPRLPHESMQAANVRHATCVQYSLDVLGFDRDGIVCIIDSDMFFIRPFSISEYMKDAEIAAFIRTGIIIACIIYPLLYVF